MHMIQLLVVRDTTIIYCCIADDYSLGCVESNIQMCNTQDNYLQFESFHFLCMNSKRYPCTMFLLDLALDTYFRNSVYH